MCRDLAQNWNIDVASELEDYMEELEDIKISFDDGETELNFAEGKREVVSEILIAPQLSPTPLQRHALCAHMIRPCDVDVITPCR